MDFKTCLFFGNAIVLILILQPNVDASALKHVFENPEEFYDTFLKDYKNLRNNPTELASLLGKANLREMSERMPFFRQAAVDNVKPVELDPDAEKDVGQIILELGYPVEKYTVQTQDGFLLGVFRIPHGKNNMKLKNTTRPAVFLQHGLLCSAADWVMNFEKDSLAFVLADAGYDVWLGNSRGNTYSRRHVSLSPQEDAFWNWSFDEMAKYDTPACIDLIINKTGNPTISYVGHSQGTIMAFAMFSTLPEYEAKVNIFIGLAPIISIDYMESPIKYISLVTDTALYTTFGRKDFLPNDIYIKALADTICALPVTDGTCANVLFVIAGPDPSNLNKTRLPVYLNHTPAGTSTKDMIHFAQMYRQKRFAMYDYGSSSANNAHYGQPIPPAYDASKITVPSVLFTATNDWLADPKDVAILKDTLKTIKASYNFPTWNHLDFIYGMDAGSLCYQLVVKSLKTMH